MKHISPDDLALWMRQRDDEWALVDVREEGAFSAGHLLLATCLPLSRIELMVADLVPRRDTPLVLCGDDALVSRAAAKLVRLGYRDPIALAGTAAEWKARGLETYTGVHVPSKAFGEFVESQCHTPHISAADLKARREMGEDIVVLDSRPLDEYQTRSIPGAIDVPGVELVYRIKDLTASERTLIVVNCGGRTRSIIGAQSLINAGVKNPVVALENGTMGWHLAGYELERNQRRRPAPVSRTALEWSQGAAERLARRFGVATIDRKTLDAWLADRHRTTYLFDVRQPEEYASGHLPSARFVQGGQLVQETDRYIAVRNARIVLCDDTGVRATVTAAWLKQMGFAHVHVLRDALVDGSLELGPWRPRLLGLHAMPSELVHAQYVLEHLAELDATFIDLSASPNYRTSHIPGAYFAIRARIEDALARIPPTKRVVLTSEDGILARLAAPEVAELVDGEVRVLLGGNEAWRAAGGTLHAADPRWAVDPDDVWLKPFDQLRGKVEDRLASYLKWEVDLLAQVQREGSLRFRATTMSA